MPEHPIHGVVCGDCGKPRSRKSKSGLCVKCWQKQQRKAKLTEELRQKYLDPICQVWKTSIGIRLTFNPMYSDFAADLLVETARELGKALLELVDEEN